MEFNGLLVLFVSVALFVAEVESDSVSESYSQLMRENCFNCSLLNRLGPHCVISTNECGDCLPGYKDVRLTLSSEIFKKSCEIRKEERENKTECSLHKDCLPGFYCYERRLCSPCLNCGLILRENSSACATKIEDCGPCFNGAVEIAVTDGSSQKPCELRAKSFLHTSQEVEGHIYVTGIIILGCTSIFASGVLIYFLINYIRGRPAMSEGTQAPREAPPPYTPTIVEVAERTELVCGFYKEAPEEECNARVFRSPTYNVTVPSTQQPPRPAPVAPVPFSIDNEETIACTWRPNYEVNDSTSHQLSNFLGQFPSSCGGIRRANDDTTAGPSPKRQK